MWKRFIFPLLLAFALSPSLAHAQTGHIDIVAHYKNILLSHGEDLSGPCGAFKITREVAADSRVRSEGWGLIHSTGNGCYVGGDVYRADTLMQPNGFTVDILRLSESNNGDTSNPLTYNIPDWSQTGNQDPSNWRNPLPSNINQAPTPTPTPMPTPAPVLDLSGVYARLRDVEAATERQYADVTRRIDAVSAAVAGVSTQVKEHDEHVAPIIAFFKNSNTWTAIISGVTTFLIAQQAQ